MRTIDVIARKRDGLELSQAEIEAIVLGYVAGEVPEYQVAAWLMAAYLRGLSRAETFALTQAIVRSGVTLDWGERQPSVVDKHSTGGVGDKTSLVVVPMVAAAGVPVAKMSGRGLGFTGGTLDKLESIPGLQVNRSAAELKAQVEAIGLAIVAQSAELAPADAKLYALRDATATVESLPLVASSVMGKKIAGGAPAIVLDVKVGRGAFAQSPAEAHDLAATMIDLGKAAGRRVRAVISPMDEPLGLAVGNALEVKEAVRLLHGEGPSDLLAVSLAVGEQMLLAAGATADEAEARDRLLATLSSGRAAAKLAEMVAAQGGEARVVEDLSLLRRAPLVETVRSPRSGFVVDLDARVVGETVVALGGGRARKEDAVDHAVGVVFWAKPGAYTAAGAPLFDVHAVDGAAARMAAERILQAYVWGAQPPPRRPAVGEVLA